MDDEPRPRAKFWKPCERCSVRDADGKLTHFDKDGNELEAMFPCPNCGKPASPVFHIVAKPGQPRPEGEGLHGGEIERVEKTDRWLCLHCLAGSKNH